MHPIVSNRKRSVQNLNAHGYYAAKETQKKKKTKNGKNIKIAAKIKTEEDTQVRPFKML